MRDFFEKIAWQKMEPKTGIVKQAPNTNGMEVLAGMAVDGTFVVAYTPNGSNFTLDLSDLQSNKLKARWFNPRNNSYIILKDIDRSNEVNFDPPADPARGNDWVLLLQNK